MRDLDEQKFVLECLQMASSELTAARCDDQFSASEVIARAKAYFALITGEEVALPGDAFVRQSDAPAAPLTASRQVLTDEEASAIRTIAVSVVRDVLHEQAGSIARQDVMRSHIAIDHAVRVAGYSIDTEGRADD